MESHDPSNDPSYPTPQQQHADGAGVTYQPACDSALTSMDGNDGDNDNKKRPFSTMMAADGDANDNPENYVRKAVGKDGVPENVADASGRRPKIWNVKSTCWREKI
jgi:hypothetical protein